MNVLIVGAGAVGQVYGRHLQRGGAKVTFFVKEKYAEAARKGFVLYPLNRSDVSEPVRFDAYEVVTSQDEVARRRFDQLWIAVSATALRGGWIAGLVERIGTACVVSLLPGLDDRRYLLEHVPEHRLVTGLINLIAYQAPLPGENRFDEDGIAYWFPPLSGSPFSGPFDEVQRIVVTLKAGGQPASSVADVAALSGFGSCLMMCYLVALEAAGWSFEEVRRGDYLNQAHSAARQALAVTAQSTGVAVPLPLRLVGPWTIWAVSYLAKWVIPLDIETYLEYHFTKVGDQTRLYVKNYLDLGHEFGLSTTAIAALLARIPTTAGA